MPGTHLYHCAVCGKDVACCYLCPDCGQAACDLDCLDRHQDAEHAPAQPELAAAVARLGR
jgi:hypothetical protein